MIDELMTTARETLTVRRVYGEPYEKDGVTILPVATVAGGGGGGGGQQDDGAQGESAAGEGGGFGMTVKPAGVYVIADGAVRWRPAVDVNKLAMTAAAIAIIAMLTRVRLARLRS